MKPEEVTSAREEMGLDYDGLAQILHCSTSSIRRWEAPIGTKQHKRILPVAQVALANVLNRHRRGLDLDVLPETNFRTMQKSD